MTVRCLQVGDLASCCYLVHSSHKTRALIIDPGGDAPVILEALEKYGLRAAMIFNTHGHADHIAANARLKEAFPDAVICVHEADAALLVKPVKNLSVFFGSVVKSPPADRLLRHGDVVEFDGLRFEVRHVPGHTAGGIVLYHPPAQGEAHGCAFCGDAVFAGSIGRTDFPGGDYRLLIHGIREQILSLPDDTILYPGHGPETTVGKERSLNPFLLGNDS